MRVVFINSRSDAQLHPGGDTIQLMKTKSALERLGLTIEVCGSEELDDLAGFDVAHIFNIQEPRPAWLALQTLKKKGIPTVLSPIYWEIYAYWFELASKERARWRWLTRLLGKKRVRQWYIRWQRKKAPANADWQLQRQLLQHVGRVLPNSRSEILLLQQEFDLGDDFEAKSDVIPNAIETDLYAIEPTPSQAFIQKFGIRDFVLEVGTIYPVKNQLALIEALFDLPVPLVIVGQVLEAFADYVETCKARAAERGNVIFLDQMSHTELPGIYALAAVHALPSWRETPGLVSLEAAAAGCRIVTTALGSTRDYFGDRAWYCYPDDQASIRNAVEMALKAPPSTDLRQMILTRYTWQQTADATLASYRKLIN